MVIKFNAWRGVALLLLGFIMGCLSGAWFQAHYLDKPDSVTSIDKQKIRGRDINAPIVFDNQAEVNQTNDRVRILDRQAWSERRQEARQRRAERRAERKTERESVRHKRELQN